MTAEQIIREILEAVKNDAGLFEAFASGTDPQTFSAGDLVAPANRLSELLHKQPPQPTVNAQ